MTSQQGRTATSERGDRPTSAESRAPNQFHRSGSSGHSAHQATRPVAWLIVGMIVGGFVIAGIGLIEAMPWLFFVGVGVVLVGSAWAKAAHIMADSSHTKEPL
jgi:hypothetical protein